MLKITVPGTELWDEENEQFTSTPETVLQLEHSLVSLSKWESKFEKPFMSNDDRTDEEVLFYIECMNLDPHFAPEVLSRLTEENQKKIVEYIESKQTATWFTDKPGTPTREVITSELIYHWMVSLQIPFECQYWHINRLLTLIRVISAKNEPPKKMSRAEIAARNRELNAQRRKQYNTRG